MGRKTKSLEDLAFEVRAQHAQIAWDKVKKEWASREHPQQAKVKKGPNKTRSSYAYSKSHKSVERLVPADFNSDNVDYTPGHIPATFDLKANFSTKNILEYIVVKRQGKRECLVARGFTKCCSPDAHCKRKRCAKCWALEQKQIKGVEWVVREVVSGEKAKIVDPFGVDPKGKRSGGKNMDQETRSRFKLTSSQAHYKAGAASW